MKKTNENVLMTKIIYTCFIVLLFMQNFALITTESFGVNGLVVFLLILSLFNFKLYYSKFPKKIFAVILGTVSFILISSFINKSFAINQILRNFMIIWLIYSSNVFMKKVYDDGNEKLFFKIFVKVAFFFFIYGFYEVYAINHSYPLILNIFSNNPSYGVRGITQYYHGWVDKARIYNLFFEPSVFATFSIYVMFLIGTLKDIKKIKKTILMAIIIFNIYFAYSRSGYVIIFYMLSIYFIYKNLRVGRKLLENVFLMLPFVTLFIMYVVGLNIFEDKSSYIRTYSGIYYLKESFSSIKYIIFGHASGSVLVADVTDKFVKNCTHNGYVDFIYQYGFIAFTVLILYLKSLIKKMNNSRYKYLFIGIICTCCCLGNYLAIESVVALIVIVYNYCKEQKTEEQNDN